MSTSHSEIHDLISRALRQLVGIRRGEKVWQDKGRSGPGLLKSLEALEAILTPVSVLSDTSLAPDNFASLLEEDIVALADTLDENGWVPEPYLYAALSEKVAGAGQSLEKKDSWCVDAASFAVTTFLDARDYFEMVLPAASSTRGKAADRNARLRDRMESIVTRGVTWLAEQALPSADKTQWRWTWGVRQAGLPTLYFTYSAAVALGSFLKASDTKQRAPFPAEAALEQQVRERLAGAYAWTLASIRPLDKNEPNIVGFADETLQKTEQPYSEKGFLGWGLAIIEAYCTSTGKAPPMETVLPICRTMVDLHESGEYLEVFMGQPYMHFVHLWGHVEPYEDRTLVFLVTRGVSWLVSVLSKSDDPEAAKLVPRLIEMTRSLYQAILNDQDRAKGVWSRGRFEIYRTQRSLEALSYLLHYLPPDALPRPSSAPDVIHRALSNVLVEPAFINDLTNKIVEEIEHLKRAEAGQN